MIKKLIVAVLLVAANFAYAQESTSSPYSIHGLGIQNFRGSIANKSMGGLSLYSDLFTPNIQNPALYGELQTTSLGIGGRFSTTTLKDEAGGSSAGKATTLDYLAISIPTDKFGFGFGLMPYRSVGFSFRGINADGEQEENNGKGNVNRVYFGAGTKVFKGLMLGAEFQYNFGRLENEVIQFPETQNNTRVITQTDVSGVSYTLSGVYNYDFNKETILRGSIIYSNSGEIESDNIQQISAVAIADDVALSTNDEIIDIEDRAFSLPSRLTMGAAIIKKSKWFIGSEAYLGNNNNYRDRAQNRRQVSYSTPYGLKAGGYYIPKFNSLTSYLERVTYRAGLRYERLGLQIRGEAISEFGTSFGISLPVSNGYSSLDLGIELGTRGTTSAGLVKENFANFTVGLSLSDTWFRKRKFK